jgi:hypothetical protein
VSSLSQPAPHLLDLTCLHTRKQLRWGQEKEYDAGAGYLARQCAELQEKEPLVRKHQIWLFGYGDCPLACLSSLLTTPNKASSVQFHEDEFFLTYKRRVPLSIRDGQPPDTGLS